jgi:proteasome accessory factor C
VKIDAGQRLQRVLRVLPLIIGRDDVPVDQLQSIAGIDARTLLDDLRAITERDDEPGGFVDAVRIYFDAQSVSVESPHFGRPTRLTIPELCALELGLAILGSSSVGADRGAVLRARKRIREAIVAMPETAASTDAWHATGPATPANEGILTVLQDAARTNHKARIVYQKGSSAESSERVVHPYAVLPVRGAWFLVAHSEPSDDIRFFRVDRVLSATILDDSFERRADVDVDSLVPIDGPLISRGTERLVVRYSPRIARWISEREVGESGSDGSFTVEHPLNDDAWAVRHVLQYGPEAEVIAPARVRERVAETLRRMLHADEAANVAAEKQDRR